MKKIFTAFLVLFLAQVIFDSALYAQERSNSNNTNNLARREMHVTPTEALNVGYTFMRTGTGMRGSGTRISDVRKQAMQLIYTGRAEDSTTRAITDCYYVFALQPKGFVIVAADERVNPILGYSYDNNFVVENMPAHVRGWLCNYEKQIEAVVKQNIAPEAETTTKWSRLKSGQPMSNTRNGNSVGPLLTTQWDQNWPFNAMCPVDENGDRCLVGCVAVALGQIMKYHNWPPKGYGYVHYTLPNISDTIKANFDTTYYDWNSMPDGFTTSGYESMAQLLADIGKALFMQYSSSSSGTFSDVQTLADVFSYDYFSMKEIKRDQVDDSTWTALIKNELNNNRPVDYSGYSNSDPSIAIGHEFVCDGYDSSDMFHFNFGWGGNCDGYYALSNLNSLLFDFNYSQSILIGIQPAETGNTISGNDTLSGNLIFDHSLYCGAFSNVTITPGTEMLFAPGKGLCFAGSVLANGTEENPILITAADTTLGWAGMRIHPSLMYYKMEAKEPDTLRLNYTTISYSTDDGLNYGWPNYFIYPATVENVVHDGLFLDNVKIQHNLGIGIGGRGMGNEVDCAIVTIDSCEISYNGKYGVDLFQGRCNVSNSLIHHNKGAVNFHNQGGIGIYDGTSIMKNCKVYGNDFGTSNNSDGAYVVEYGGLMVDNEIYNNSPSNASDIEISGMNLFRGGEFERNLIHDNTCGSVMAFAGNVSNNKIYNNNGIAISIYMYCGAIRNNLICNNSKGIYCSYADMPIEIVNNTIVNNGIGIDFGQWQNSELTLSNNIIWNDGAEVDVHGCHVTANNNIIKGGSTSVMGTDPNNIISHTCDKNPKFVNPTTFIGPGEMPENMSFELDLASPAIDNAYMDSTMVLPALDLAGNPRIKRVLDIGAYENQSDTIHPCFLTEGYSTKSCVGLSIDLTLPYRGEQCSFAWYHNGDMMQGPFSDTLHLENVTENDEGDYFCVISNTIGIDTSSIIHLGLSPQLPMCIEAINGPDTIYHFQHSIPFSINNVMDADMIQWVVSEGLSYTKTSDTTILLSVNQAVESAFLYVVASNGCGACADTAMIQFSVLPSPENLQLNGPSFVIVNYGYPWPQPELVADGAFHYDAIEWQSPSWISTVSDDRKLIFVSTQSYQDSSDTIFARWFINGYGYGVWTPYPIKVVHPEDYGDIVYVSTEGVGNGSSWADATDIQTALSLAPYLDKKVWVASGIYEGDGSAENAFVIEDGVLVYGGFVGNEPSDFDLSQRDLTAHSTIFDGQHLQRTVCHSWFWFQDADSQPMIDGVIIQNGYGNNVFDNSDNGILLRNCIIRNGVGDCGGVEHAILENCVLSNNQGDGWAGAIKNSTATNCSFVNNMASVSVASSSTLNNCILWNNGGYDQGLTNTFSYCAIQEEMIEGEGNITLAHSNDGTSPDSNYVRFVDPENGDFRLAYGSACINAGTPDISDLGLPSVDLQGLPRVLDGRLDMGAFEYYPVPVVEIFDTICEGNSIVFFNSICTTAGSYVHHTHAENVTLDTLHMLHLTISPTPSVVISGNQYICESEPVSLTASVEADGFVPENLHFTWYASGQIRDNMSFGYGDNNVYVEYMYPSDEPYHYSVEVTYGNGVSCVAQSGEYLVYVKHNPTVVIDGNPNVCYNNSGSENVELTAWVDGTFDLDATYTWFENEQYDPNISGFGNNYRGSWAPSYENPYIFTVEVTNGDGCTTISNPFYVNVYETSFTTDVTATSTEVCVGGEVTISANVDPVGDYDYSWTIDGQLMNSAYVTVIATTVGAINATVTVTDYLSGCMSTDSITIIVHDMPETPVVTVDNDMIFDGDQVTLSVTNPIPGAIYIWYRNGFVIEGATQPTLVDHPTTIDGETMFYSYIVVPMLYYSGCVSDMSNSTVVTVNPVPAAIVSVEGDTMFCEGGSTTLHVEVTPANIPYTYQWFVDNELVTGATSADYVFAESARITPYNIHVMVSANSGYSSITYAPDITVVPQPAVVATISNENACVGGTTTLTATVSGAIADTYGYSYEWYRTSSNNPNPELIATSSVYTTFATEPEGSYNYWVTVSSNYGCYAQSEPINFNVVDIPTVAISRVATYDATVCDGGSTAIEAIVTGGYGEATYQWYKNNLLLGDENSLTLYINNLSYGADDIYTVVVALTGSGCSNNASVSINSLVEVVQYPAVTIQGSDNISYGQSTTLTASGADFYEWSTGDSTASITVSPTTTNTYTVTVTSLYGCMGTTSIIVTVNNVIPTVITENVTNVTTNTAVCGGNVTSHGGAEVIGRGVCWSTSQHPTISDAHTIDGVGTGSFVSSITGLAPNTTYYARAYATNSIGTAYGEETVFTTLCDTVVSAFNITTCDSYTWNGETYTESGTYMQTFTNLAGCDSVVTLHLTITNTDHTDFTDVACDSYTWNGETYTQSGAYSQTFTNQAGCDSVVTLYLTVNNATTSIDEQTACESFTWINGVTYTESTNTPTFTLTNAADCDSIVTLHLTINNPVHTAVSETACESFTWNGTEYTVSGDYTYSHADANGCTQVDTLHLTITNTDHTDFTDVACDSYTWNGETYTQSGAYSQTFTNSVGCDSVVTLHLTINQPSTGDTTASACESFFWNGTTYTSSGSYQAYLTNSAGCDSVVTLHLTITNTDHTDFTDEACDSYTWNGETYTESGNYTQTFTNSAGCDSVVTLHLTIYSSATSEFTIVTEDPCYSWNNVEYCETGDYIQTLQTVHGCDSVVTLHLTITVGVNDYDDFDFKVYPNPTSNIVNVECIMKNEDWGEMKLHLCDAYGRLLNVVGANNHSPLRTARIDLSQYASGVYFVKAVADGKSIAVRKVVKQ